MFGAGNHQDSDRHPARQVTTKRATDTQLDRQTTPDRHTIINDDQQRSHQVTHSLDIANVQVLPDVTAHDIAQFLQVGSGEVMVVPIASLHVFVHTMQV